MIMRRLDKTEKEEIEDPNLGECCKSILLNQCSVLDNRRQRSVHYIHLFYILED
jgi:hypothetical protein